MDILPQMKVCSAIVGDGPALSQMISFTMTWFEAIKGKNVLNIFPI